MKSKTVLTEYTVGSGPRTLRAAVASDLHNSSYDDVIGLIKSAHPDVIFAPGDTLGALCAETVPGGELTGRYLAEAADNDIGLSFLREVAAIAPTYCSVGNHEVSVSEENRRRIAETGALLLDDSCVCLGGLTLGGLSTGGAHGLFHKSNPPDLAWLNHFAALGGRKILLCHHPEYWERHILGHDNFLTVAGHAHGGQRRAFGRGLLAPGQGLFPRYTSGVHERGGQYLVISRGLRKECGIPRINNPPEIVIININY